MAGVLAGVVLWVGVVTGSSASPQLVLRPAMDAAVSVSPPVLTMQGLIGGAVGDALYWRMPEGEAIVLQWL